MNSKTSKIVTMFNLQDELNSTAAGDSWINGFTNEGRSINWRLCMSMELSEMIDSFSWKHWKSIDAKNDMLNAKIECVDIWHFILSEAIRVSCIKSTSPNELSERLLQIENKFIESEINPMKTMEMVDIIYDFQKKVNSDKYDGIQLMEEFITVSISIGLDYTNLYKLYIGKNILNRFRQDNGYKSGKYIKIWDGVEDNVVMSEVISKNEDASMAGLYTILEDNYKRMNSMM
ncbi:MAG TPA: dUTPase [Bacteroidia bacterium]|nr:dUTPase [Bacteroidia bacterium]